MNSEIPAQIAGMINAAIVAMTAPVQLGLMMINGVKTSRNKIPTVLATPTTFAFTSPPPHAPAGEHWHSPVLRIAGNRP